jgi:pimeloyl-ACP methyl ester carboxylesterase
VTIHRVVPFRGDQIEVIQAGDPAQPALGFLHGMLGNARDDGFLSALAAATGRRVVAPSLPGFGPSDGADQLCSFFDWVVAASEIVTLCGLAGVPMVAASIGAMLALEVSALRPEAFTSIVAISPLGLWSEADPVVDLFAMPVREQRRALLARPDVASSFYDDEPTEDKVAAVERGVRRYRARRSAASLVWPIPDHGFDRRAHLLACPVGVVWGTEDAINPLAYARRWEAVLPLHAGSASIAAAGHCADWDQPDAVAEAAAALLDAAVPR